MKYSASTVLLTLILATFSAKAENEKYGYRVTGPEKTLIQIARDVYNDQRQWKIISYWNNIKPPYNLSVGQVLVLPLKPVNQIAQKNSVAENEVPTPDFVKEKPNVQQQINKNTGFYIYTVNERAPSLYMVALENFGNAKMASVIAKWNGLEKNSKLSLNQKLKLKVGPRFKGSVANSVLIDHWNKLGNAEMVTRLGGKTTTQKLVKAQTSTKKISLIPPTKPHVQATATTEVAKKEKNEVKSETKPDVQRAPTAAPPSEQKSGSITEPTSESYWLGDEHYRILNLLSKPNSGENKK